MSVHVTIEDGIGRLTLSDPPLNILTRKVLTGLREGVRELESHRELRVAILQAEGPHFSVGASVAEHLPPEFEAMIPEFTQTLVQLTRFPLPLLGVVRGRCLGGGFELALAADLLMVGESAQLGIPEIRLGVFPPPACALLPGRIPAGTMAELLFTGDPLDARAALDAGLAHRVVPDAELDAATEEIAGRIARNSAAALRAAKAALIRPRRALREERLHVAEDIYLHELMSTADAVEGLTAFTEKRSPRWSHR